MVVSGFVWSFFIHMWSFARHTFRVKAKTMTPLRKGQAPPWPSEHGDSTYPLHQGAVVKLKTNITKRRKGISRSDPDKDIEHQMFFWIQRISASQPASHQERVARIMIVLVPNKGGRNIIYELTEDKRIQLESLKKWMRLYGYEHLGDVEFRVRRQDYVKFYKITGIKKTFRSSRKPK